MLKSISRFSILLLIFISTIFLTCSKDSTGPKEEGTLINASNGGTLTSTDGLLTLTIPAGALNEDTYINIEVVAEADYPEVLDTIDVVGEVYEFSPNGLEFSAPVIVEIDMPDYGLDGLADDNEYQFIGSLLISNDGTIEEPDSSIIEYFHIDGGAKYSCRINHFSKFTRVKTFVQWTDGVPESIGHITLRVNLGPRESIVGPEHQVTVTINAENGTIYYMIIEAQNHYFGFKNTGDPIYWPDGFIHVGGEAGANTAQSFPTTWNCAITGYGSPGLQFLAHCNEPGVYRRKIWISQLVYCAADDGDEDSDDDGILDDDDNCPHTANTSQQDFEGDGIGDACDNCPLEENPDQADTDLDDAGDVCDNCPDVANADQADSDNDGIGDVCDNCPDDENTDQADGDGDGYGDVCDSCPNDFNLDEDLDADGVDDICDNCLYDVNPGQEDKDSDGVGDACDNCPDDANSDQADTDFDGTGDACEGATDCDDDNLIELLQPYENFFGFKPCSAVQPRLPYEYILNTMVSGVPFYTANDQTTTLYWGGLPQVIDQSQWGTDLPFERNESGFNFLEWYGDHWDAPKLLSTQDPQTEENWVIFFNVMEQDIPSADPDNQYQYGFVFDRDGNTNNNYQPHPDYANDFFKDTDFWIVANYHPDYGWGLEISDATNGVITTATSAAKMLISGNTIIVFIPRSEFPAQNIGYRVTAFRHDGSWANDVNAGADTQPSVDDGLKRVDIGPQ